MSLLSLASLLPHELLVKIFYNLEQRPQHRHSSTSSISFSSSLSLQRSDILVCALVCHDWYYAAVDTLWREVDLQSVESFIDFGRALDASFSYLGAEPSTAAYSRYSTNNWPKRGGDDNRNHDDSICPTDYDDDEDVVRLHSQGSFSSLLSLTASSKPTSRNSPSTSSSMAILRPSRHSAQSPSPGSLSSSPSSSSTSLSSSSSTELSSLLCSPSPGPVGFAGKSYIRTLSLAGTSDCQGPRPFPYLPSCITDRHLFSMSTSLTHLTSILLNHCVALTDVSVIQLITLSSPYLQRVDLTACRLITNLTVQVIAQLCSQLEDLCLHSCGLITDEAIEELAHQCFRLKRIDLGKCSRISDRALLALLKNSGKRVQLNNEMKVVRTQKARLTRIGVAGCRGVSFKGLMAITDHLATPALFSSSTTGGDLSSLVSLEFTCPAPIEPSPQWHPTASKHINPASRLFQALPSTLEEISIFDAYSLTHQDIICLVDKTGFSLKSLKLDDAIAIQSDTLSQVLTCCPRLEVLAIPRANQLGNAGVAHFAEAKCAQSLVELDLSACSELTDESLTKLATRPLLTAAPTSPLLRDRKGKGVLSAVEEEEKEAEDCSLFPNLRRLDLSYNDKMTLTGIIPLVMSLKNLCALDVSFCGDGVTTAWSSSLEALRPILNPMSMTTEPGSLTDSESPQEEGGENEGAKLESMDEGTPDESEIEVAAVSVPIQESLPLAPFPPTSPSLQTTVSPIYSPGRRGLGGYSGPRLQLDVPAITTEAANSVLEDSRRRDSASSISSISSYNSDASTSSSLTSLSSMSSECSGSSSSSTLFSCCSSNSGTCVDTLTLATRQSAAATSMHRRQSEFSNKSHSHQEHLLHRRRRNSSLARIQLTARFDVLEVVPCQVGYSGAPHLDSWFTSQHQQELLQLFQIQIRQQRESQLHQQHQQQEQQRRRQSYASFSLPFFSPSLYDSCGSHSRESKGCKDEMPDTQRGCRLSVDEEAAAALLELNEVMYLKTGVHPGDVNQNRGGGRWRPRPAGFHGLGAGGVAIAGGTGSRAIGGVSLVRDFPGRHNSRRRSSLVAKGIVSLSGQCEISAWGLSLLKEEWAMV